MDQAQYLKELRGRYQETFNSIPTEKWFQNIYDGSYRDADIAHLLAERDALIGELEIPAEELAIARKIINNKDIVLDAYREEVKHLNRNIEAQDAEIERLKNRELHNCASILHLRTYAKKANAELKKLRSSLESYDWIPIGEKKPEALKRVEILAEVKLPRSDKTYLRPEIACYVPAKTILSEDFLEDAPDLEEYDEESDRYFVKEGWFEDSFESDTNWFITRPILYWRYIVSRALTGEAA